MWDKEIPTFDHQASARALLAMVTRAEEGVRRARVSLLHISCLLEFLFLLCARPDLGCIKIFELNHDLSKS